MKDDFSDEDDQSTIVHSKPTTTIPFAQFYMTKGTSPSNSSVNQCKLSEQLTNTSSRGF